jgi:hypothetical protein
MGAHAVADRTHFREVLAAVAEGSVSKVEMVAPMALIYKVLFPSISTFETPPNQE